MHYSKYSSVLEIEKALLGIELGRIGKLLTKSNKDRRNMQIKLSNLESTTSEEISMLKKEVQEKVEFIRRGDWDKWRSSGGKAERRGKRKGKYSISGFLYWRMRRGILKVNAKC